MSTIVFAWELGGDYGHLSRLLPIALALRQRGHTPVFLVRELLAVEAILTPHGLQALQAPLWLGKVNGLPDAISYPEMLMRFGYLNARALTGICRAWRHVLALLKPDLIVLDHAPTALLATRGLGVPRVQLGDGFCIPPTAQPIPHFRSWQRENTVRLADSEQHVLTTANAVLMELGEVPMRRLSDLMACQERLLCAFEPLDHYGAPPEQRTDDHFVGPVFSLGQGAPVHWPGSEGPRIFAYLKASYGGLDAILAALKAQPASVLAHVPGVARKTVQAHQTGRMSISVEPLDMAAVCSSCDLALSHGGGGTTAAMLLAGKPQMLFPMQMEQTMTARQLCALGVAVQVAPEATGQMPRLLKKTLADTALREAAEQRATQFAGYDQHATVRHVVDRCEALLSPCP